MAVSICNAQYPAHAGGETVVQGGSSKEAVPTISCGHRPF